MGVSREVAERTITALVIGNMRLSDKCRELDLEVLELKQALANILGNIDDADAINRARALVE